MITAKLVSPPRRCLRPQQFWVLKQFVPRILSYLSLKDVIRLSQGSQALLDIIRSGGAALAVRLSFEDRQNIRRQIFNQNSRALPSLFTHLLIDGDAHNVLCSLLRHPGAIAEFEHERSGKELKLHHPYFYRQLSLKLGENSYVATPIAEPAEIPLPHDLSLTDFVHVLCLQRKSLRRLAFHAYGSCPLPWNTTPSRVCPRDINGSCLRETQRLRDEAASMAEEPYQIRIWCPDCALASADHDACWLKAGLKIKESVLSSFHDETERERIREAWRGADQLGFPQLETLELSGWALANFLSLLRMLGFSRFDKLKKLSLQGVVMVSPSLTEAKDTWPRPRLYRHLSTVSTASSSGAEEAPSEAAFAHENERLIHIAQCASFHFSPFAKKHTNRASSEYFLALFNGGLWNAQSFPALEEVSIRVGNFDDSARWITPWFENCLSFSPSLHTIEFDHHIIQFNPETDPLIRFFSMALEDEDSQDVWTRGEPVRKRFRSLSTVRIRLVDSAFTLLQVQRGISRLLRRSVTVRARKILVALSALNAGAQAELISGPERCFSDNGLLALNFDGVSMAFRSARIPQRELYFGSDVRKLLLKHYTPSDVTHSSLLALCRFAALPSGAHSLRRVDVQLDLPHVWQVPEEEAKRAVEQEVALLKQQLSDNPSLEKVAHFRVGACTRLTYGGNNWSWWERLITGAAPSRGLRVQREAVAAGEVWALETRDVLPAAALERFQCEHVGRRDN